MTKLKPLGPDFYVGARERIRREAAAAGVDGMLILDANNVVYASGFVHIPNERPIALYVPVDGAPVLLVPLLEQENATIYSGRRAGGL